MRKAAPFKPEDAQISWVPAAPIAGGGREYLVTLARRDIIESYMKACADAGAAAGLVDLASLNLINAALASGAQTTGGRLAGRPRRARLRHAGDRPRQGSDLLPHAAARGGRGPCGPGPPDRDVPRGSPERRQVRAGRARPAPRRAGPRWASGLRRGLEERMNVKVESLDFRGTAAMRDRISAGARAARRAGPRRRRGPPGAGGLMLRTNLSTRPFYNERAVHALAALVAIAVLGDRPPGRWPASSRCRDTRPS